MIVPEPVNLSARQADLRSLALHTAVAEAMLADPSILERARRRVDAWRLSQRAGTHVDHVNAWAEILRRSCEEVASVLVEDSERMQELRSASPFAGSLAPQDRWRVLRQFNDA